MIDWGTPRESIVFAIGLIICWTESIRLRLGAVEGTTVFELPLYLLLKEPGL